LHEDLWIKDELIIERVAGGWNYKYYESEYDERYGSDWKIKIIVFVPFSNEFQKV
jgi:hypothetical protein